MTILLFGILVGLDNLQLASAIGLAGLKPQRKWGLILAFAFFEMTMPLLGMILGNQLHGPIEEIGSWLGPLMLFSIGLIIVVRAVMEKEEAPIFDSKWVLISLPFLMSLDNLFAGFGLGTAGYPVLLTSLVVGLCAGSMCFIGLFLGEYVRRFLPGKVEVVSGLYLIGLAAFSLFFD